MSGEPDNTNPRARRMKEVFDFESHPGLGLVCPEIAKQLAAACKPPADAKPVLTYHPDDDEEEDGAYGPTWFLEWPMWLFIALCILCAAGVWQVGEWACDLWNWLERGML